MSSQATAWVMPRHGNSIRIQCCQGCSDFRCREVGPGVGGSLEPPGWTPPNKKGSCDGTPQTNPGTAQISMEGGGREAVPWGGGAGRGLEQEGGTYFR